jgi:hypothetical protein
MLNSPQFFVISSGVLHFTSPTLYQNAIFNKRVAGVISPLAKRPWGGATPNTVAHSGQIKQSCRMAPSPFEVFTVSPDSRKNSQKEYRRKKKT